MPLRGSHLSVPYKRRLLQGYRVLSTYLSREGGSLKQLANRRRSLDTTLENFVNWMYETQGPKSLSGAKHAVLAVQHLYPQFRRRLYLAWQTLTAWEEASVIRVRPPLPLSVLAAFVVYARAQATLRRRTGQLWFRFAIGLELGFFGLLRPGEICGLLAADIALPDSWVFAARGAVLRIEAPKNRRHLSRHQFVLIEHEPCCSALAAALPALRASDRFWPWGPSRFRALFREVASRLGVLELGFSPASLRAGGASHLHITGMEISRLKFRGRWASERTLAHYVQRALSRQVQLSLSPEAKRSITTLVRYGGEFLLLPDGSSWEFPCPMAVLPAVLAQYGTLETLRALHGSKRVRQGPLKGTPFRDLTWAQLERFSKRCSEPELRNYARAAVGARSLEPSDLQPCRPVRPPPEAVAAPASPFTSRPGAWWVRCRATVCSVTSCFAHLSAPTLFLVACLVTVFSRPQAHFVVGRFFAFCLRWAVQQAFGVVFQFVDALLFALIAWLRDEPSEAPLADLSEATCPRCIGLGPLGQVLLSCTSVLMGALVTHLAQRLQLPSRAGRPVLRL